MKREICYADCFTIEIQTLAKKMMKIKAFWPLSLLLLSLVGCVPDFESLPRQGAAGPPPEDLRQLQLPLSAPCTINVTGYGSVNIEDDYIANVVACENGNAPMEALKAQAIQARGYLYYVMLVTGKTSIGNSQSDQVYKCSYTTAGPRHYEAARATRGQYLAWKGNIIAPFYVAGAIPANQNQGSPEQACNGAGGSDPTSTQKWVTYNLGKSECNIDLTPLGWIPSNGNCAGNPQNRGCASQNGQACLANRGWFYDQMQPYYYGDDITIAQATGTCGGASTASPNYDAYCMGHERASYCVDATERVLCSNNKSTRVEACPGGCLLGECLAVPVADYCEGKSDGWHCMDAQTRGRCEAGKLGATETCTAGCEANQCAAPENTDPDPEDENSDEPGGGDENDGDENQNPGEDPEDEEEEGDDNAPGETPGPGADEDNSLSDVPIGSLLTPSQGIGGGCAQTGGSGAPPLSFLGFLAAALFISSRKGGRRHRQDRERYIPLR